MIHLLLCFPGTCPTLPLFSPPLAIPLVHSENRSISHSCCLDFPGEKEKIIWECIHIKAFYTQNFTNLMVLEYNFYYYRLISSLALISPHPFTYSTSLPIHSVQLLSHFVLYSFMVWSQLQTAHCLLKTDITNEWCVTTKLCYILF